MNKKSQIATSSDAQKRVVQVLLSRVVLLLPFPSIVLMEGVVSFVCYAISGRYRQQYQTGDMLSEVRQGPRLRHNRLLLPTI